MYKSTSTLQLTMESSIIINKLFLRFFIQINMHIKIRFELQTLVKTLFYNFSGSTISVNPYGGLIIVYSFKK